MRPAVDADSRMRAQSSGPICVAATAIRATSTTKAAAPTVALTWADSRIPTQLSTPSSTSPPAASGSSYPREAGSSVAR